MQSAEDVDRLSRRDPPIVFEHLRDLIGDREALAADCAISGTNVSPLRRPCIEVDDL
jgi:hypothetical protein